MIMGMCIGCSPYNAEQSVITQAIAVLRKYGTDAHIYLPGVGMLNGLQAGNYLDSAGTTPGAVDQPVGLVLDAAGSLGVELVDNSVGVLGSTLTIRCTSTAVGSGFYSVTGNDALVAALATPDPLITFGKTYKVTLEISSVVGGIVNLHLSTAQNGGLVSTPFLTRNTVGVFEAIVTPDVATRDCITALCGASGQSITFKVSVREVTGIAASQPTTSVKPILRRGAVNLLTYSGDFSNAAWVVEGTASKSGQVLSLPAIGDNVVRSTTLGAGTRTFAVEMSGVGTVSIFAYSGADGIHGTSTITLSATPTIYPVSLTSTGVNVSYYIRRLSGNTATSVTFGSAALFQGTYTAAQIQALGGIPLTTTAPASTALGPYWWDTTGGKTLVATFPAGNESVTVIDAKSTGQVTLTGQNVVGAYNVSKQFGPEVVTNGDNEAAVFTFGTMQFNNITATKVAAVGGKSGSVMLAASSSASSVAHQYNAQNNVLDGGKAYQITVDIYVPTGGVGTCRFFDNSDGSFFSPSMTTKDAWVTVSAIRQAKGTAWTLGIGNNIADTIASGSPAFYLDNISVKEVVSDVNGKIIVNGALTAPELTLLQGFANKVAGL